MSKKVEILRSLVEQRLTAAVEEIFGLVERTIVEYEDELCRTKEENQRQKQILDSVLNSQVLGDPPGVQYLPVFKEDIPSEQEEDWTSPSVDPDPEPPGIKEEQEEMGINATGQIIPLSDLVSTAASPGSHPSGLHSPQSQNTFMCLDEESPSGKRQRMNSETLQVEGVFAQDEEQEPLDIGEEFESDDEQQELDMDDEDAVEDEDLPVFESSFESSDEFSDTEEGETTVSEGWTSRSGDIQWAPTNVRTQPYTPAPSGMEPGPTRYATAMISSVVDSFNLYITDDILKLIVDHTNLQGKRSVRGWRNIDIIDLRAYIGLVLLGGVYQSHNEPTRSLWDDHTGRDIFRTTMGQKTFRLINTCLRFEDRQARSPHMRRDKLAALRDLWEMWNARLPVLYNPGQDVCVDEQLIPFQGRCFFRRFHPKNPAKNGLKVWVTCDVDTCYAWRMSVDTGQQAGARMDRNRGKRVVLDMTEGLSGVTVTCDSLVSSFALGEELLQRNVALLGNLRHNKPDLPPQLLRAQGRAAHSSVFAFTRTHTAVSYVPKRGKNILLISTKHREAAVSSREKRKPLIICDYSRCKGGVCNLDKVCGVTQTCIYVTSSD
uniref:PiggyBac transposable element-derived protein domain-containing protein n=1 Tax=Sphaeramia orbicularis TaxID=375764 RepID=A0A672YRK9_9TELE